MKLKYFSDEQMRIIWRALDNDNTNRHTIMIEVLALTGMRLDELCRMSFADVDAVRGTLTVHHGSKGSESRTCPVGMSLCLRLVELRDLHGIASNGLVTELIGRGSKDTRANTIKKYFGRLKAQLWPGQTVPGVHGLRHTKAKRVYEQTRDIYAVQQALGHRSMRSTEMYMSMFNHERLWSVLVNR